jgi:hypothetical protein
MMMMTMMVMGMMLQVEKEHGVYPDSVIPCISTLKNLVLFRPKLRLEFSQNANLLSCILRGQLCTLLTPLQCGYGSCSWFLCKPSYSLSVFAVISLHTGSLLQAFCYKLFEFTSML